MASTAAISSPATTKTRRKQQQLCATFTHHCNTSSGHHRSRASRHLHQPRICTSSAHLLHSCHHRSRRFPQPPQPPPAPSPSSSPQFRQPSMRPAHLYLLAQSVPLTTTLNVQHRDEHHFLTSSQQRLRTATAASPHRHNSGNLNLRRQNSTRMRTSPGHHS
ncbi:hypothetical protein DEO72_LG7g1247 [Vigna unguiculata]|uniref:Uncharacterized protein n=1 Tax=Vigna unguiculata TaxID=3917 RepID=A0A4D6MGU6_VIGUN|nr:hypothetical protein DEO72_LG7g1247 [Vigna unguiculata]